MTDLLAEYSGRLYIDWGGGNSGKRSWNQRVDAQDIRQHAETAGFPADSISEVRATIDPTTAE